MRSLLFVALLLCFSSTVLAQSNYKPGYIVNAAGDTVKGFINYREWIRSPRLIEFKSKIDDKNVTKYTAAMLQSFVVNSIDKYVTYRGPISMDKTRFPDLPSGLDSTVVADTVFLQMLYEGKPISLLKHNDFKTRLFIDEGDGKPTELKYYQYYSTSTDQVISLKLYTNELKALSEKYNKQTDQLLVSIERSKYDEEDLQAILRVINHEVRNTTSSLFGSRYFIGVMANCINTQFDGENRFVGRPGKTYLPRFDLGIDFFTNKFTQRIQLRAELAFAIADPTFMVGNSAYNYTYSFKQYIASFSPQIMYNIYNTDALKVNLGTGFGLNYSLYGTSYYRFTDQTMITAPSVTSAPYQLEKFNVNFLFRTGVTLHKKFEVFALYSPKASLSRYAYFSITNRSYGIGINYLFGK
jgi:hypothetical protein